MNTSDCVINNVMHCCVELLGEYGDCNTICCDDFNGRTAHLQANDNSDFVHGLEDLLDHSDMYLRTRKSHDRELNDSRTRLLELCACVDMCLLNGLY